MEINVDGIPVNCSDTGQGPETVLILQGWGTNESLYADLARHLSRSMRVILPELPGFGKTPEPERPFDAADYAAFTLRLLGRLGVERTHLIGHSNGGRIIIKLCTSPHEGVEFSKLVFIDSAGIVHPKSFSAKLRQKAFKAGSRLLAPFPEALESYKSRHGSADYRSASPVMRQTLVKLVNEDLRSLLPLIDNPVLLIWGSEDADTPIGDALIFQSLLKDSGLVEVKGAGHYSYLEQPAFVYRVLDNYFGGQNA